MMTKEKFLESVFAAMDAFEGNGMTAGIPSDVVDGCGQTSAGFSLHDPKLGELTLDVGIALTSFRTYMKERYGKQHEEHCKKVAAENALRAQEYEDLLRREDLMKKNVKNSVSSPMRTYGTSQAQDMLRYDDEYYSNNYGLDSPYHGKTRPKARF